MRERRNFFALLIASPLLLVAGVRVFALDRFSPLVAWVSFTPYVAGLLFVGAGLAFWKQARVAAGVFVVVGMLLCVLIAPRMLASDGAEVRGGTGLTVLTANLLKGHASPHAFTQLVRATDPDVIAMQELTPETWESLIRPGGIGSRYPYRFAQPQRKRHGVGVMSRLPLKELPPGRRGEPVRYSDFIWPELRVGDMPVAFRTIHPNPPVAPRQTRGWQRNLADLPGSPSRDGLMRVVAGDFNATVDHRAFRALLDRGYTDAGYVTGNGLTPTWEGDFFRLTIDHVIVDRRVAVRSYSVHDLPGSDHNAVFVRLAVPAARR